MNFLRLGQGELISHISYLLKNLKRTIKMFGELMISSTQSKNLAIRPKMHINPIIYGIGHITTMVINKAFHLSLCLLEFFLKHNI